MNATITLTVNTDHLSSITDHHLHALWHAAQASPAPMHDRDAGELVQAITFEIVRRWLKDAPVELYRHQPTNHYWHTLVQHGKWNGPGGAWMPHPADTSATGAATTPNLERG